MPRFREYNAGLWAALRKGPLEISSEAERSKTPRSRGVRVMRTVGFGTTSTASLLVGDFARGRAGNFRRALTRSERQVQCVDLRLGRPRRAHYGAQRGLAGVDVP